MRIGPLILALWFASAPGFVSVTRGESSTPTYNRDIRPILADNCFGCHGPDSAKREADLRLDLSEAAVETGAIVPGDVEASELWNRVSSDDAELVMPPPETKKRLTDEQTNLLAAWIRAGARYEPHWAFQALAAPAAAASGNSPWVRNAIDPFVLRALEELGLAPAAEADRRTLARRVSLDLTGLPPEPFQVEAFVHDTRPDAYERLVDELLASPAWGEHRARYWLDYARYGDTHGIHFDNYREMWSYRDWVIAAFNRNLPFDQFTLESLAGDLLPNAKLEQKIASGFNRCNITTNEGGAIDEEYLVLYTRDRTETFAQVWLGMTAGCAVCHDHKFDPLTQAEFYELAAFFNNTTQRAMDGNIRDTPPIVIVPTDADRARWDELAPLITAQEQFLSERAKAAEPEFAQWLESAARADKPFADEDQRRDAASMLFYLPCREGAGNQTMATVRGEARRLELIPETTWSAESIGPTLQLTGRALTIDDVGRWPREQPFTVSFWIRIADRNGSAAVVARMDVANAHRGWDVWLQQGRIACHLIHQWPGNAAKVVANEALPVGQWTQVTVTHDGSGKAAGIEVYYQGRVQAKTVESDSLTGEIENDVPFTLGQRTIEAPFQGGLSDVRIYERRLDAGEIDFLGKRDRFLQLIRAEPASRNAEQLAELRTWWLENRDEPTRQHRAQLNPLLAERTEITKRGTVAHVMQERPESATAFVLKRGEYTLRSTQVHPATPRILPEFPAGFERNRLGLARWLLLPEHPLTARVLVNRFWQEVFGEGIVRTTGDFGVMGELPSHPELLDFLALEFQRSGWDVKAFFRLMVTSATYRQAAIQTPEKTTLDPRNRWLSRGPRFRMDAEMVRDQYLAASGLLVRTIGGPSVRTYQPPGIWEAVAMIGSDTRDYKRDEGDALYRRGVYTFWKRSAPPAFLETFNAPSREVCTVRRERTNTPLQALATLNDEPCIEAARALATRTLRQAGTTTEDRLDFMARRILARPWTLRELQVLTASLESLSATYVGDESAARALLEVGETAVPADLPPAELAAWTMIANQVLNLDEALNK